MIKFYEVRHFKDPAPMSLPEGKGEFTIGFPYEGIPCYTQAQLTTCTREERAAGDSLIEANLRLGIDDGSTPEDYQRGRTIYWPILWDESEKYNWRYFFNLNSPAVRKYLIERAIKTIGPDNKLFLDNFVCQSRLLNPGGNWQSPETIKYIADNDDRIVLCEKYMNLLLDMATQIKERTGAEIMVNGCQILSERVNYCYDYLLAQANFPTVISGIMLEERWHNVPQYIQSQDVYIDCCKKYTSLGMKVLFCGWINHDCPDYWTHPYLWLENLSKRLECDLYLYANNSYSLPMHQCRYM